jgi:lipoprotein-anchoring transpeptidase ErfK/SrfK
MADGVFAIHGSSSIPPHPASHGCVRVPIHSSRWIYDILNGTPIHLL